MHELGVVFQIMDSLEKVAEKNNVTEIKSVTLELGQVSTVVESLLNNCWVWAAKKRTLFNDAKLIIEPIPALTYCENCQKTYGTVEHGKKCPYCGSQDTYLLQGNEFNIKEIEVY